MVKSSIEGGQTEKSSIIERIESGVKYLMPPDMDPEVLSELAALGIAISPSVEELEYVKLCLSEYVLKGQMVLEHIPDSDEHSDNRQRYEDALKLAGSILGFTVTSPEEVVVDPLPIKKNQEC